MFGDRIRQTITPAEIRTTRDQWLTIGPRHRQRWITDPDTGKRVRRDVLDDIPLAPATVNHRLRALENLWTVLDGRHATNPVREIPEADERDAPPRAIPSVVLRSILSHMRESATRIRLQVMIATGLPHASVMRLTDSGFDAKSKTLWVPGRQKGKGTRGRLLPLTNQAVVALKAMRRWDAWGKFSTASMQKVWNAACAKAGVQGTRPYDTRHSFGTSALAATGDLRATQMLLGHSTPALTERYARAAVNPALVAAVAKIQAASRRAK
ncbi:MAG: tyrosine-type recombinase/integrase [Acidobacteria bacterium]|nr:tyrosine-type recombinase/integrase [Acidobacteriota bacterium]